MPDDLTFAVLLTGAGLAIAADIITGFVELMKAVLAPRTIYGALAAFLTSGLLYGLAAVATKGQHPRRGARRVRGQAALRDGRGGGPRDDPERPGLSVPFQSHCGADA